MTAPGPIVDDPESEPELPLRAEGRWVGPEGYGCRTCGWSVWTSEGVDRDRWLSHTHDPICDVEERFARGDESFASADVRYLLGLLDTLTDNKPPHVSACECRRCNGRQP